MAVLWNQGLRKVGGRVIESKGVRRKVFKNVLVTFAEEALLAGVALERVSILLGHQSLRIAEKHCGRLFSNSEIALLTTVTVVSRNFVR